MVMVTPCGIKNKIAFLLLICLLVDSLVSIAKQSRDHLITPLLEGCIWLCLRVMHMPS